MSRALHVYFLRPVGQDGPVKIGSSINARERLTTYSRWSPVPLEIAALIEGGSVLERRFHALFAADHLHHEWFRASDALTAAIGAICRGDFQTASLPKPRCLITYPKRPRENIEANVISRRLNALVERGINVPPEVREAAHTWGHEPGEVARRRAIVREFVFAHDPRPVGGRAAS